MKKYFYFTIKFFVPDYDKDYLSSYVCCENEKGLFDLLELKLEIKKVLEDNGDGEYFNQVMSSMHPVCIVEVLEGHIFVNAPSVLSSSTKKA